MTGVNSPRPRTQRLHFEAQTFSHFMIAFMCRDEEIKARAKEYKIRSYPTSAARISFRSAEMKARWREGNVHSLLCSEFMHMTSETVSIFLSSFELKNNKTASHSYFHLITAFETDVL